MPKLEFSYLNEFDTRLLTKIYNYLVTKCNSPLKSYSRHDEELCLYIFDILYDRYCETLWEWGV